MKDLVSMLLSLISTTGLTVVQQSPLSSRGGSNKAFMEICWCSPWLMWPSGMCALMWVSGSWTTPPLLSSWQTMLVSTGCVCPHPGLCPKESRSWQDLASFLWFNQAVLKSSLLWNCSGTGALRPVKNPEEGNVWLTCACRTDNSERLWERLPLKKGLSLWRTGTTSWFGLVGVVLLMSQLLNPFGITILELKLEQDKGDPSASKRRRSAEFFLPTSLQFWSNGQLKGFTEKGLSLKICDGLRVRPVHSSKPLISLELSS